IDAGPTTEPTSSDPNAQSTTPAATATADPELEPPGLKLASSGCPSWPPNPLQPRTCAADLPPAHSLILALPAVVAPAARSALTAAAARLGRHPARACEPQVSGSPTTAISSLTSPMVPTS